VVATAAFLVDIGRSLREAFFMFWLTLWPLVLGFGLSGAIQSFVSRDAMQRRLGNHRTPAVVRASGYGMVSSSSSSSCSYTASAMARSLFMKGADYIAAMVFVFASTNLVIELGIVLTVLMGWQFAVSEFIGGFVMIVLLATVGWLWLRGRLVVRARERLQAGDHGSHHRHGAPATTTGESRPLSARLRSSAGWAESATYTMSDLTMVRRELIIGYTVAGFLAVLVPTSVWQAVFITGHGFWTSLENALVGPFIAIISFVCSIGNVSLAASLWKGDAGGVLGTHVDRRSRDRSHLPDGGSSADRAACLRCPRAILVELHHVSEPLLPRCVRRLVLDLSEPRTVRRRRPVRAGPRVRYASGGRARAGVAGAGR
jgi:uncharacterized protein